MKLSNTAASAAACSSGRMPVLKAIIHPEKDERRVLADFPGDAQIIPQGHRGVHAHKIDIRGANPKPIFHKAIALE